jgi:hypothetical protein
MRPRDDAPTPDELLPDLLAGTRDRTDRAEVTDALDAIDGALTNNIRPLTGAAAMTAEDYMRRPCSMYGESLDWAVLGGSEDGLSAGVIAWCWDEADAHEALAAIKSAGGWLGLTVERLGRSA